MNRRNRLVQDFVGKSLVQGKDPVVIGSATLKFLESKSNDNPPRLLADNVSRGSIKKLTQALGRGRVDRKLYRSVGITTKEYFSKAVCRLALFSEKFVAYNQYPVFHYIYNLHS